MEGYIICILVTAVITWLVAYVLGFDTGYAKGRREERHEWIKKRKDEIRVKCRTESAQRRMKGGNNGEESRANPGE